MGKTYRHQPTYFDEDSKQKQGSRKAKHNGHANNRKTGGGMKIVNEFYDDEDELYTQVERQGRREHANLRDYG